MLCVADVVPVSRGRPMGEGLVTAETPCVWRRDMLGFARIADTVVRLAGGEGIAPLERTAFSADGALRPEVLATARASIANGDSDCEDAQRLFRVLAHYGDVFYRR